jgi:hypothetical protein
MSAKRYFQLSFLWPVVLPSAISVSAAPFLSEWIWGFCNVTLREAGIPYAFFAAVMILWSRKKEAASIRRSTYLSPLLFLPVLFGCFVVTSGLNGALYRWAQFEMVAWLFIYGVFASLATLTVGYCYVALVNLAFIILRSCGAFQESPTASTPVEQNSLEFLGTEVGRLPVHQGSQLPDVSARTNAAECSRPPGSQTSVNPVSASWADSADKGRAPKKQRIGKPHFAWDPLRTASLALLAPLIFLSAFAFIRRHSVSHGQSPADHRVWNGKGSGAGRAAVNMDRK